GAVPRAGKARRPLPRFARGGRTEALRAEKPRAAEGTEPRGALQTAATIFFLLFVATLPWSIAAMSIGLGLCAASTALAWAFSGGAWRRHAPLFWPMLGWLLALVIAAVFAQDRAASLPRIRKGFLP